MSSDTKYGLGNVASTSVTNDMVSKPGWPAETATGIVRITRKDRDQQGQEVQIDSDGGRWVSNGTLILQPEALQVVIAATEQTIPQPPTVGVQELYRGGEGLVTEEVAEEDEILTPPAETQEPADEDAPPVHQDDLSGSALRNYAENVVGIVDAKEYDDDAPLRAAINETQESKETEAALPQDGDVN